MDTHVLINLLMEAGYITDYCGEYGEPGYTLYNERGFVALGDIWCKRKNCSYPEQHPDGTKKVHSIEFHYPRIFKKLDEEGMEFQWYDEWIIDHNNDKAYRIHGDSYQWQPSVAWDDSGELLTPDDDIEYWIEYAVNNPRVALPSHVWSDEQLMEEGFKEYKCGFQNGWYPGQTDNPVEISQVIADEYAKKGKNVDILFKLSYVSQFDLGFCVFVREENEDD